MTTEQTQGQPETRPSEVRSDALLGCPFCGRDTGCYHEIFEITHKSMGFDAPRIQGVVYCHDCGAMAPTAVWYMRQPNAGGEFRRDSDVNSTTLLADSGGEK